MVATMVAAMACRAVATMTGGEARSVFETIQVNGSAAIWVPFLVSTLLLW